MSNTVLVLTNFRKAAHKCGIPYSRINNILKEAESNLLLGKPLGCTHKNGLEGREFMLLCSMQCYLFLVVIRNPSNEQFWL